MTPSVLALDIATTTGWAWHRPGMPRPFFSAERMPAKPDEVGEPTFGLRCLVFDLLEMANLDGFPITHIFYEKPFVPGRVNSMTQMRLMGMAAMVEAIAVEVKEKRCKKLDGRRPDIELKAWSIDLAEWRKHFLGRGAGFKKNPVTKKYYPGHDPKELAIQRCAEYGWHTDIHDAAEACGILDYALTMIPNYHRPWRDNALMGGML